MGTQFAIYYTVYVTLLTFYRVYGKNWLNLRMNMTWTEHALTFVKVSRRTFYVKIFPKLQNKIMFIHTYITKEGQITNYYYQTS